MLCASIIALALVLGQGHAYETDPTPCSLPGFAPPVFKISKFLQQYILYSKNESAAAWTEATVTDTANGYTTRCAEDMRRFSISTKAGISCAVTNGVKTAGLPTMQLKYNSTARQVAIRQSWVCDQKDGTFDTLWEALVTINLTAVPICEPFVVPSTRASQADERYENCTLPDSAFPLGLADLRRPAKKENKNAGALRAKPNRVQNGTRIVPTNDTPCIGRSFTYPNWRVQNWTRDTFSLENRATRATVVCPAALDGWVRCRDEPGSQLITYVNSNSSLSVNQTWSCSGQMNEPVRFLATGSAKLRHECVSPGASLDTSSDKSCDVTDSLIMGTLEEPIRLKPHVRRIPPYIRTRGCVEASRRPSWALQNISLNHDIIIPPGLGLGFSVWFTRALSIDLVSNAVNFASPIRFEEENRTDGHAPAARWESFASKEVPGFPGNEINTDIYLDQENQVLKLKQSWTCYEEGQEHPIRFTASGQLPVAFECTWRNTSEWFIPAFASFPGPDPGPYPPAQYDARYRYAYQGRCRSSSESLVIKGAVTSEAVLEPLDVLEPAPTGHSCTIASVLAPSWTMTRDWGVRIRITDPISWFGYNAFPMFHSVLNAERAYLLDRPRMVPYSPRFDPDAWYQASDDQSTLSSGRTSFQLDLSSGYFALNDTWRCADKDDEHGFEFSAKVAAILPLRCRLFSESPDNIGEQSVWCDGPGPAYTLFADSVSWKASN